MNAVDKEMYNEESLQPISTMKVKGKDVKIFNIKAPLTKAIPNDYIIPYVDGREGGITVGEYRKIKEGWKEKKAMWDKRYPNRKGVAVHKAYFDIERIKEVKVRHLHHRVACGRSVNGTQQHLSLTRMLTDWNKVTCFKCLEVKLGVRVKQEELREYTYYELIDKKREKREKEMKKERKKRNVKKIVEAATFEQFAL